MSSNNNNTSSSFDVIRFRSLLKKYAKSTSNNEIETSQVVDLLKEFDRKRFGSITLKDVQSHIDIDKYGSVCFSSVESFASNQSLAVVDSSSFVTETISLFYNNYSSDKGKRLDNKSDRLIEENDMIKLIIQMSDGTLSSEDASKMIKELQSSSSSNNNNKLYSVKKLAEKLQ